MYWIRKNLMSPIILESNKNRQINTPLTKYFVALKKKKLIDYNKKLKVN